MKPIFRVYACLLFMVQSVTVAYTDDLAERAGLSGGVASFINPAEIDAALALARDGRFLVYVSIADEEGLQLVRKQAEAAGLLGRSLYVEHMTDTSLPLADHVADLVVAPEVANEAEVLRVLSPVRGRAFVGERVLTKPALKDSDDWTHRLHGPDNNPVSQDSAFRGPAMLQYLAMPMQTSFQGSMLVANGRRIELSDWVTKKPDRNDVAGILRARCLYNGQPLWERQLPKNIEPDMPICALDGDRIYLAADDTCRVMVIDAETGEDVDSIKLSDNDELRVNWLAIEDNKLYVLIGKSLETRARLEFMGRRGNRDLRLQHAFAGEGLVALDLQSGRELWRHQEPVTIDYRTIAVRMGRVYFYSEGSRLACVGEKGSIQWENRDAQWLKKFTRPQIIRNINHEAASTLIVGPSGQLRLTLAGVPAGCLFDAQTGRLLWEDKLNAPKCLFLDNRYLSPSGIFEAATGERIGESGMQVQGSGCGMVTWVPALDGGLAHVSMGVKSPCGVGAYAAGGMLSFAPSQCDCWPHQRGAAGFAPGAELFRQVKENPGHPLVSFNGKPKATASASAREDSTDASGLPLDESHNWPQYRGGIRRVGYSDMSAGKTAHVQWVSKLDKPFDVPVGHDMHRDQWLERPTPPVTAGRFAFYGSSDGSIRAVNIENGRTAWTFWTGGAVLTSPAVSNGRLFAGSGDGWVYCLETDSGKLLWKWRGAPADRRSVMYGKLTSLWPVTAVMVADGRVYGAAGQAMQNGSVTFALDTETGQPQWTTWTEPAYESRTILEREDFGFGPAGQLTLLGANLVVRTYLGIPAVFNAETGRRIPPSAEYRELCEEAWAMGFRTATSGQELVVLGDNTILQGGYPLLGNPDIRHDKSAAKFVAWRIEDNGQIPVSPLPWWAIPHSQIAPAVDEDHIAMVGGVGRTGRSENSTIGLSLWSRDKWRAEMQRVPEATNDDPDARDPAATPFQQRRAKQAALQAEIRRFKTSLDMEHAEWRIDEADVSAVALTDDAVVAVLGERTFGRRRSHPGFTAWKLCAFERHSGKDIWSVELPGEPVFNGIAPAADGSWVLTLRDGSLFSVGK